MCWPGALLLSWDCCCQRHSSALLGVLQCRAAVALGLLGGAPLGRDTADIFSEHKLEHPGVGAEVGLILSDSHDVRRPHPLLLSAQAGRKAPVLPGPRLLHPATFIAWFLYGQLTSVNSCG